MYLLRTVNAKILKIIFRCSDTQCLHLQHSIRVKKHSKRKACLANTIPISTMKFRIFGYQSRGFIYWQNKKPILRRCCIIRTVLADILLRSHRHMTIESSLFLGETETKTLNIRLDDFL